MDRCFITDMEKRLLLAMHAAFEPDRMKLVRISHPIADDDHVFYADVAVPSVKLDIEIRYADDRTDPAIHAAHDCRLRELGWTVLVLDEEVNDDIQGAIAKVRNAWNA